MQSENSSDETVEDINHNIMIERELKPKTFDYKYQEYKYKFPKELIESINIENFLSDFCDYKNNEAIGEVKRIPYEKIKLNNELISKLSVALNYEK